jgi:hypothetical protein
MPVLLLLGIKVTLPGAEITVPRLEMVSLASAENDGPVIASVAAVDIALDGGYKYQAYLGFSFESNNLAKALAYRNFSFSPVPGMSPWTPPPGGATVDKLSGDYAELVDKYNALAEGHNALLERMNNQAALSFRIARATARDIFTLPLDLSYFIGISDYFCSGDDFAPLFGAAPIGSGFRGFFYFPQGVNGDISRQYNGIHGVRGTGLSFTVTPWANIVPVAYLYQDFSFADPLSGVADLDRYSGDLRVLVNMDRIKLEGFAGGTIGPDKPGVLRGGVLAFFSSGRGTDFLLQCGIPGWNTTKALSIDNLYFLMEPRIHFNPLKLALTFFYHPAQYLQIETPAERGRADVNLKLSAGDLVDSFLEGGLETTLGLKVDGMEDFMIRISPFVGFITNGLRWDAKLRINPLGADALSSLVEFFIGVRTAY